MARRDGASGAARPAGRRVVVKVGTSTLTRGSHYIDQAHMLELVRALVSLREQGHEVVLVSSGAIAAGRAVLDEASLPRTLGSKQLLASVGQVKLIGMYADLFAIYRTHIGQLLLTRADLENRERYLNARDTITALLSSGVLPIINENDAVSIAEIKVGDNDNLAAITAILVDAAQVILLTDQQGLYDRDPRVHPDARLLHEVESIDDELMARAGGGAGAAGTGGMQTKLQAARKASQAGIELVIISGDRPQALLDAVAGRAGGTTFRPALTRVQARKLWLGTATASQGELVVDDGAREALQNRGSSLLPSGICQVRGSFDRGSIVAIVALNRKVLGRGISRYSSGEIDRIKGLQSDRIEETLGFSHGSVVVHRDDLSLECQ